MNHVRYTVSALIGSLGCFAVSGLAVGVFNCGSVL